jgi:Ca2+-binding RTX toxin-like protein
MTTSAATPAVSVAAAIALLVTGQVARADAEGGRSCYGRRPTIVGTQGDDVLRGAPSNDVIVGRGGDDQIWGGGGNDRVCGGRGNDRVYGNPGHDWVRAGPGRDRARGGRGTDFVLVFDGTGGNDMADGGRGPDDGCAVDVAYDGQTGDEYTDDCETVVGAVVIGPGKG